MKRYVIVGLGLFGSSAAECLYQSRHEVIAVDTDPVKVDQISRSVTRAVVGDGRQVELLTSLGAEDADAAVVSTGEDIGASILAAMALHDVGVKEIFVKVISKDHARIVKRFDRVEAIFPEQESALNLASRLMHSQSILQYVRLGNGLNLTEMAVPIVWEGKSLRELNLRTNYKVSIVAIHDILSDKTFVVPDPDKPLMDTDTLILSGSTENLDRVIRLA